METLKMNLRFKHTRGFKAMLFRGALTGILGSFDVGSSGFRAGTEIQ